MVNLPSVIYTSNKCILIFEISQDEEFNPRLPNLIKTKSNFFQALIIYFYGMFYIIILQSLEQFKNIYSLLLKEKQFI